MIACCEWHERLPVRTDPGRSRGGTWRKLCSAGISIAITGINSPYKKIGEARRQGLALSLVSCSASHKVQGRAFLFCSVTYAAVWLGGGHLWGSLLGESRGADGNQTHAIPRVITPILWVITPVWWVITGLFNLKKGLEPVKYVGF